MSSKPTIVFCHGAWHSPAFFTQVIALLEPLGYKCVNIAFPSVGRVPTTKDLSEDIAVLRTAILHELDTEGKDVLIHAHSWGGLIVNTALEGLSKAEREREGKKTAVTILTYVSCFIFPEGQTIQNYLGGFQEAWQVDEHSGVTFDNEISRAIFYHELPVEEQDLWISRIRPHSLATFQTPVTSAAWRTIPSVYLVCEKDLVLPPAAQEAAIAAAREAGAPMEVERIVSGHSPHLTQPNKIVEFIARAAGGRA